MIIIIKHRWWRFWRRSFWRLNPWRWELLEDCGEGDFYVSGYHEPWSSGIAGTFTIVPTYPNVQDNGGDIIVIDSEWSAVALDTRNRVEKKSHVWVFPNPLYKEHPSDFKWFGAEE